jgi:hypothetical protein
VCFVVAGWPAGSGHPGVALVVLCRAAPRARVLPCGSRSGPSRPASGPLGCALATVLLPLTLRSECPPSPQTVRAWAVACRRTLPWLRAHRPPSRLGWPSTNFAAHLCFPTVLPTQSPGLSCRLSGHRGDSPVPLAARLWTATGPASQGLPPCLCGSSIALISPTSLYSELKRWSPSASNFGV